jgi:hypothetical protein
MSFHDRDYYGYDAAAGVRLRLSAPALSALLVLHLLVFLLFLLLGPKSVFLRNHFLFSVAGLTHDWRLHTLVTHSFAGLSPVSLLLGLLVLWWAGKELEPLLGSGRFLLLYLLGDWADWDSAWPGWGIRRAEAWRRPCWRCWRRRWGLFPTARCGSCSCCP